MNSVLIRKHSNLFRASRHAFDVQRDQHAVVEASAGTGKTFALEELVLEFLLVAGLEVKQLLLMTFTEKATAELRERIRSRLTSVLEQAEQGTSDPEAGPCWVLDGTARQRVQQALLDFESLPVLTIHGFCNRVLTEFAFENRQLFHHNVQSLSLLLPEALRALLRREVLPGDHVTSPLFREQASEEQFSLAQLTQDLETLLGHTGLLLPEPPLPDSFDDKDKKEQYAWLLRMLLPDVRREVQRLQAEQGTLDYQDMIQRVHENVQPHDGAPSSLTQALRTRYQCAIVDEFQDTDPLQWGIFREVFLNGEHNRLVVIGDPKQAIYSFRSADVYTYLDARQAILEKTGRPEPFTLDQNFRSNEHLIAAFNQLFADKEWFDNGAATGSDAITYRPVTCGNSQIALSGAPDRAALHLLELPPRFEINGNVKPSKTGMLRDLTEEEAALLQKRLKGQAFFSISSFEHALREHLPPDRVEKLRSPLIRTCLSSNASDTTQALHQAIAREIQALHQHPPDWTGKEKPATKRPLRLRDICVLTRTKKASLKIGKELEQLGIPYAFYRQGGLFQTREALEWLDLLNAIRLPNQRSWVQKAWLTRFFNLPLSQLASAWEAPETASFRSWFLEWHQQAEQRQYISLFDDILKKTQVLEHELLLNPDSRSVFSYQQLLERLGSVALARNYSLDELAAWLKRMVDDPKQDSDESDDILRQDSQQEAVQLMTIHTSKGLEFPVVFLDLGGVQGNYKNTAWSYHVDRQRVYDLLPDKNTKQLADDEIAEENQRLLYVALTRAAGRLYLPYLPEVPETASGKSRAKTTVPLKKGALFTSLLVPLEHLVQHSPALSSRQVVTMSQAGSLQSTASAALPTTFQAVERSLPQAPEWLGDHPKPEQVAAARFETLRKAHLGFQIGSFSRWQKQSEEARHLRDSDQLQDGREPDEPTPELSPASEQDRLLPGGVQTGNFLHKLLEDLDYATAEAPSPEAWLQQPRVQRVFEETRQRFQLSPEAAARAAELLWHTLQKPLREDPELILCRCSRRLHEVDFHFALPEPQSGRFHFLQPEPLALEESGAPWLVQNGFLQGSIDLVFQHQGKTYFLDWKSNRLSNYAPATMEETVRTHYELQKDIYLVATLRWLGVRNEEQYHRLYGGAFYVFLRGMADTQASCFFPPPSWEAVQQIESRLGTGPR